MKISRGVAEVVGLVTRGVKHPGITSNYRRIETAVRHLGYAHEHAGFVFTKQSTVNTWEWALVHRLGLVLEQVRVPKVQTSGISAKRRRRVRAAKVQTVVPTFRPFKGLPV